MLYKINNNLIRDDKLSVADKFILIALESYAFLNEQRLVYPKIETIASDFNISRSLVKRFLTKNAPKQYYKLSHHTIVSNKFVPITFNNYTLIPISSDYTLIPIELIRYTSLSYTEKVILITILMLFKFNKMLPCITADIMQVLRLKKKSAVYTHLRALQDNGYIKIDSVKNAFQITPNMERNEYDGIY